MAPVAATAAARKVGLAIAKMLLWNKIELRAPRAMAARASSSSSSLAYFHDIGSLSRASALANDAQRSVRQLEEQVAAAEQSVPSALEAVRSEATSALQHLDKADGQRETFEATAKAQLRETARLAEQLNPPREQLRRLRDAQLVLHVLVVADELLQEVNQAQRAAADASPPSGATSATMQLLLVMVHGVLYLLQMLL